ncbi:NUDIX domain-containing protein [Pelagicoccus sp. SDUM812003]|uniref:NUDIX domain-containing protein n=1 Tax=Pelagicoccus sp. SDUM812003 TaxID=3041267 RepID=UPI00280F6458|nr:NUDIX domain-containing protein [Pelagicoccus sp. SDUM812003]MDQ8201596.1 NUDIX domain-containing protein [Pelagicoccus sp. SDUM812003]
MSSNRNIEQPASEMSERSYRIGVLLYFQDASGRLLLIRRARRPNQGLWCAVGGKLEMSLGESPYECAIREAKEEVGVDLLESDLALRCVLAEREYEGSGHWLMFIFQVKKPLSRLPNAIEEGSFSFFEKCDLSGIDMPALDRSILLDRVLCEERGGLHALRACPAAGNRPELLVEEEWIRG